MANVGPDFLRLRLAVEEKQASLTRALESEMAICREIQRIEAMDFAQVRAQNVQVMAHNAAILTGVEGLANVVRVYTNMVMAQNTAILTSVEGLTDMLAPLGDRLTGLGDRLTGLGGQLQGLSDMFLAEKILNKARNRNVYARAENSGVSQAEGALTEMYNCNENLAQVQVNDPIPAFPRTPADLVQLEGPVCITILTALSIEADDNDELKTLRMKVGKAIGRPTVFLLRA